MTARDVYFSVQGVKNLFSDLLIERGKAKNDACFKDNQQQLMNLENMNTLYMYLILKASPVWGYGWGGWGGGK